MTSPSSVLVVGFGNPLRQDDGAGWTVAEAIGELWGDRVRVVTGQQVVPEWALYLAEVDLAFLVDASIDTLSDTRSARRVSGQPSGTGEPTHSRPRVTCARLYPTPTTDADPKAASESPLADPSRGVTRVGGHAIGPPTLLALAADLYGQAPETYLVSIPAVWFGFGDGMSDIAKEGIVEAIELIDAKLSRRLDNPD